MFKFKKFTTFSVIVGLTFALGSISLQKPNLPAKQYRSSGIQTLFQTARTSFKFNNAKAGIVAASQTDMIRGLYMLINGPGSNGYPAAFTGSPDNGLLGVIRQITGEDALGGGLSSAGYSKCAMVPSTGETSMTEDDGSVFRMVFSTPIGTIPTGYTGAGETYDKRVVVQYNGTTFMNIEFNCDTNVGWVRFNEHDASPARNIEAYWDTESATATKLEMYMHYEAGVSTDNGNEYFTAKFETATDNKFKYWIVRSVADSSSGTSGFRAAAYGDSSTRVVNGFLLYKAGAITDTTTDHTDNNNVTTIGAVECLDFDTSGNGTTNIDGDCASMTLDTAGAPISDGGDGFSIYWAGDTSNGMKNDMTALVDP